jgi:hypothetical protein
LFNRHEQILATTEKYQSFNIMNTPILAPRNIFALGALIVPLLDSVPVQCSPTITQNPSSQTVLAGQDVVLNVGATGTDPLSFAWALNGVNLPDATNSQLSLKNIQPNQSGTYRVIVSD